MALQIWLPLNGNLNNQGVSDATFSAYSNTTGMGVNASGKLGGSCYERTAAAANGYRSSRTFLMDKDVSMCCWAYVSSTPGDSANGLITNHNHVDGSGFGITVKQISTTDYRISCSEGYGGGSGERTFHTHYGTTNIKDAWHHLGLTFHSASKTLKLYVDGVCEKTVTNLRTSTGSNPFDLFNWSTGYIAYASYRPVCKLNDVRLYDHCLSGKEMSEIAKGLVAHYPLSGNYGATPSLLSGNLDFSAASKIGTVVSGMGPEGLDYIEQTNSSTTYQEIVSWGGTSVSIGETYTASFYARSNTPNNLQVYFYNNTSGVVQNISAKTSQGKTSTSTDGGITFNLTTEWKQYWVSWTFGSSGTTANKTLLFRLLVNNAHVQVAGVKLEKGSKATAWLPKDTAYTTEYDCSGYGHHGTITGTLKVESGAPRYDCATVFDGASAIVCGRSAMIKDEITVNLWAYMSDWSNYSGGAYRIISCTEGGGWNIEPSSGKLCFACGTGSSANAYKNVVSTTTLDNLSDGWHMITGTYNGLQTKIYIDGVLEGTNSAYTTKTPLFYNSSNGIFIGAEAASSAITPGGQYFNGKISDVRIYAKALSATDIKEMYNTPISIGKTGAAMAYNFKEV